MYLADNDASAQTIVENQRLQASLGAGTMIMTPDEIAARCPFYHLDDIVLGSHNTLDEGYFDGGTIFDWWKKQARQHGVEMVAGEVTALSHDGRRVTGVTLASGEVIAAGELSTPLGPGPPGQRRCSVLICRLNRAAAIPSSLMPQHRCPAICR